MEDILFLIGRILVAVFYLDNARNHFLNLKGVSGYAASKGVPMPQLAVLGTGALLVIAAVTIGLGIYPDVGVAALVLFFVPTVVMMHNFWAVSDPMQRAMERIQFMKDMALLGSALMYLAIPEAWALGLG
jgi:uncharacterized membrane protein YphA (DoxX/SURF4 family)